MSVLLTIFGAAVVWFLLFYLPVNSCVTLAPERGRRQRVWVAFAFFTGPVALVVLYLLPRLGPTPEELHVEVWRMGVQQAERAVLDYYASSDDHVADDNPPLRKIIEAATTAGPPQHQVRRILERRARMEAAYAVGRDELPSRIDMQTVEALAQALALDPAEAINTATSTLRDPLRAVGEGQI